MAVGQMMHGSGCHDMLAAQCQCIQCGQDLSAMSYQRRVAHVKKCSDQAKQRADSAARSHGSGTAKPAVMHLGAESGHFDPAAALDTSKGVQGILAQLGMESHISAFHKEEVDIRALPELSDEDLIYLGVSDVAQRRRLLQVARALKKGTVQRPRGVQSTASALQPAVNPASSATAQRTASATSVTRCDSCDSRLLPQVSNKGTVSAAAAVAVAPALAYDTRSCKGVQQAPGTRGKDAAMSAGSLPAEQARTQSQRALTSLAGSKRSAGNALTVLPGSGEDADFAEEPQRKPCPPLRRFAKLSKSSLSRQRTDRPSTTTGSAPAAAAAAKDLLSACSGAQDTPSMKQSTVQQGPGKAHSMPSSTKSSKHHLATGMGSLAAASQENASLAARIQEVSGLEDAGGPPSLEPCQSSHPPHGTEQPDCSVALLVGGGRKRAPDGTHSGPASSEAQLHGSEKPSAYLSGALGRLLATRSVRACISQNGSYSRQAELRLLQTLYPGEGGQPCSSARMHQHGGRGPEAWSSDDEENAGKEAEQPPLAGCTIRCPGVQQVPKEASLWAMSRQDPQQQCSVQSMQQRQAARKAVGSGTQPAEAMQPRKDARPAQACVTAPADSMSMPEQSSAQAGEFAAQQLDKDVQLLNSDTSESAGDCTVQGAALTKTGVCAREAVCPHSHKQTVLARDKATSDRALRVQSLRQELAAAEAVVAELKSWLADAEAEVEEEEAH